MYFYGGDKVHLGLKRLPDAEIELVWGEADVLGRVEFIAHIEPERPDYREVAQSDPDCIPGVAPRKTVYLGRYVSEI